MNMLLFALDASAAFGHKVAAHLQVPLALHEERVFEDGEYKVRPLHDVRGHDVFVIQSLHDGPDMGIDARLCRLLFFIATLRDAGAARITAVIPYFAFARQDRRSAPGDPVTLQYMARLLEAVGTAQVICMDIHNVAAFQNAFRIPAENLQAHDVFADWLARQLGDAQVTVVSPDIGGILRARELRDRLAVLMHQDVGTAFITKQRSSTGVVSSGLLTGDVRGRAVVIYDDIISTGATVLRAQQILAAQGATRVCVAASHGVFAGKAAALIASSTLNGLAVTDTIPALAQAALPAPGVVELSVAPLFAASISRLHCGDTPAGRRARHPS